MQVLTPSITVRNAGATVRCARAGMGAAITSAITVTDSLQDGSLVSIDLPGLRMERSFYVVHNKRRSLFPAALKLIESEVQHSALCLRVICGIHGGACFEFIRIANEISRSNRGCGRLSGQAFSRGPGGCS